MPSSEYRRTFSYSFAIKFWNTSIDEYKMERNFDTLQKFKSVQEKR
jgi:hypothetical protein